MATVNAILLADGVAGIVFAENLGYLCWIAVMAADFRVLHGFVKNNRLFVSPPPLL